MGHKTRRQDHYEVLGVSPTADHEVIRAAYRALVAKYHPDHNPGDARAELMMKRLNAAWRVLGDPAKRRQYNELTEGPASTNPGHEQAAPAHTTSPRTGPSRTQPSTPPPPRYEAPRQQPQRQTSYVPRPGQTSAGSGCITAAGVLGFILAFLAVALVLVPHGSKPDTASASTISQTATFEPTPPVPPAPTANTLTVNAPSGVNLRAAPSTDALALTTLPNQTIVEPTGRTSGKYTEVTWGSVRGWAATAYLTPTSTPAQNTVAQLPAAAVSDGPRYADALGRYAIAFPSPASPVLSEEDNNYPPFGMLTSHTATVTFSNSESYSVIWMQFPRGGSFNVEGALDGAVNGMVAETNATIVNNQRITVAGIPGRDVSAVRGQFRLRARVFLANRREYVIGAAIAESIYESRREQLENFINSFTVTR